MFAQCIMIGVVLQTQGYRILKTAGRRIVGSPAEEKDRKVILLCILPVFRMIGRFFFSESDCHKNFGGEIVMPSAQVLESKKARVEAITEHLKGAAAGVLVDYKGISVEDDTKLRKELREAGVKYYVEKNSMLRFALHNVGIEGLDYVLEGTTAIALSDEDQTAPARILGKYIEGADEKSTFSMKAGFIGTELYDAQGVLALSKIPSKEVLLAQLLGSLQSPLQKFAATVQAVADKKAEEETA